MPSNNNFGLPNPPLVKPKEMVDKVMGAIVSELPPIYKKNTLKNVERAVSAVLRETPSFQNFGPNGHRISPPVYAHQPTLLRGRGGAGTRRRKSMRRRNMTRQRR
jgi:hypothetical protein